MRRTRSRGCSVPKAIRILAIVPARGGSKRLPGKNIRRLGGRPLIAWSIASALQSGRCCDVLVSTDDEAIASAACDAGALVPWLRPAELASDTATTSDVLRHALAAYEEAHGVVDAVLLLQPTCPLRRPSSIDAAIDQFLAQTDGFAHTVVSVSPAAVPPEWCFRVTEGQLAPVLGWSSIGRRSQDLEAAYQLNGSVYLASAATVRAAAALVSPGTIACVMHGPEEAVDIDTEADWRLAESFLSA